MAEISRNEEKLPNNNNGFQRQPKKCLKEKVKARVPQNIMEEVSEESIAICVGNGGSLILVIVTVAAGNKLLLIAGNHALIIMMNTLKPLVITAGNLAIEKDKSCLMWGVAYLLWIEHVLQVQVIAL